MSENNSSVNENQIHYIFGDQEFILQQEADTELQDVICADGSRTILLDGQYLVADTETILIQEADADMSQYFINENTVGDDEATSSDNFFEATTKVLQFIEEDTSDGQQIIYYTDGDSNTQEFSTEQDTTIESVQDEDGNIYPFKRIKLANEVLDFSQEEQLTESSDDAIRYAVIAENESVDEPNHVEQIDGLDLSKITGRNLITGQTVTLHSYMEKLKKKLNTDNIVNFCKATPSKKIYNDDKGPELSHLLDKKISIGKTKSGKNIVGKIIHVERKPNISPKLEDILTVNNCPPENLMEDQTLSDDTPLSPTFDEQARVLLKRCSISNDSFEEISKTLCGVMDMESVQKKLAHKNIVVKLVEKRYLSNTDNFVKNISYSYGYMGQERIEEDDNIVIRWKFMAIAPEDEVGEERSQPKFAITTSLTIQITYGKEGDKSVRVNLNPAPGNFCIICARAFKSNLHLRLHMSSVHNTYGNNTNCEVCGKSFENQQEFEEHKIIHVQEGKLFACTECNRTFLTQNRLQKHLPVHDLYLRPLECSVCELRCSSEWALKKHLLTHTCIKPYSCDICHKQFLSQYDVNFHKKIHFPEKHFACNICLRTFSRHSNLLRHIEIHKGSGALYKCEICFCSYNFASSLTRHMVQNHIDATDKKD